MDQVVGQQVNKVDVVDKVTGEAQFAKDLGYDGELGFDADEMLHLKVLRAPHPHAKINEIDTTKAKELSGVEMVVTADDVRPLENFGLIFEDQQVLVTDKTRYMGDSLAIVAAETEKIAHKALDLIEVDYEELEVVTSPWEAMQSDAPIIQEDFCYTEVFYPPNDKADQCSLDDLDNKLCNCNLHSSYNLKKGDIDTGFAEADHIFTNEFQTQHVEQLPLEPEAGVASYDEESGEYTLWTPTQWLHDMQYDVANSLDVAPEKIKVIQPTIGGAFGKREDVSVHIHLALMAELTGRPVRLAYTREESMITQSKRHPINFKFKTGVTEDGKLTAWEAEVTGDVGGCASSSCAVVHQALYHCTGPYNVPHVKGKSYAYYTNNTYTGAMRGFGATQAAFAYESQIDIIAKELGFDPAEFRLKNAYQVGSTTPNGQKLTTSVATQDTIVEATKNLGYEPGTLNKDNDEKSATTESATKKRGTGIGTIMFGNGFGEGYPDHAYCNLKIKEDGRVVLETAAADVGQGVLTVAAQLVAEVLNISVDRIEVPQATTEMKNAGSTSATRQTIFSGNAAKLAAENLLGEINNLVFLKYGLNFPEFEVSEGEIRPHGDHENVTFGQLAKLAKERGEELSAEGCYFPETIAPDEEAGQSKLNYVAYTFNTNVVEVEVDTETGEVDVLNVQAAIDLGKAIHPQNVEGQSEGGIAMGMGMALTEEQIIEDGITLNPNMSGYIVPTSMDMPNIDTAMVESGDAAGPYGAKGIGEPVMIPVVPGIINAIEDAIGVRIKDLPATPDKILKALSEKEDN
ncbi:MAG: xanthine dehydrogenase family protein molybdopterin-binding subunit [Bacillota bacterium]